MKNPVLDKLNEFFPYVKTITVRFLGSTNPKLYSYTYYLRTPVKIGDIVVVPTKDTFALAKVTSVTNGFNHVYRGVYSVVQVNTFNQVEELFKKRANAISDLVMERNQLTLRQDELIHMLDQYKKEKENHELFYSNSPDYCF